MSVTLDAVDFTIAYVLSCLAGANRGIIISVFVLYHSINSSKFRIPSWRLFTLFMIQSSVDKNSKKNCDTARLNFRTVFFYSGGVFVSLREFHDHVSWFFFLECTVPLVPLSVCVLAIFWNSPAHDLTAILLLILLHGKPYLSTRSANVVVHCYNITYFSTDTGLLPRVEITTWVLLFCIKFSTFRLRVIFHEKNVCWDFSCGRMFSSEQKNGFAEISIDANRLVVFERIH